MSKEIKYVLLPVLLLLVPGIRYCGRQWRLARYCSTG
jgi:hypothetical protein